MNREELINELKKDLRINDFSDLTSKITYDVRLKFFQDRVLMNKSGQNIFYSLGLSGILQKLFTKEEAKELIDKYSNFRDRSIIILNLSDEEKLKYIDEVINNDGYEYDERKKFSIFDFIPTIKNQDILDKVLLRVIDKMDNFNSFEYFSILGKISSNHKIKVFDKIIEMHSKGEKNEISEFLAVRLLNALPVNERINALSKILNLKDNTNKDKGIILYNADGIIKCFSKENELDALKLLKIYMDETGQKFTIRNILMNISFDNFKEALKILSPYYNINDVSFDIVNYSKEYSNLNKYIDIFIEVQNETGIKLIDGTVISGIMYYYPAHIQEKIFADYVFNKKIFDFERTIIHISNTQVKYKILDKAVLKYLEKGNSIDVILPYIDRHIINRNEYVKYPDGSILFENINNMYIQKYKLNKNNFNLFIQRFGYMGTKFLDNQNIINALRMNEEDFIKYLEIFNIDNTKLNNNDINTICNAFFQREFRLVENYDYNIFSIIESLLNYNDIEYKKELVKIINEINEYSSISSYTNDSIEDFIIKLYNHDKDTINILHSITNNYIAKKREIYSKKRLANINSVLNLNKKIAKQYYKKKYIEVASVNNFKYDVKNILSEDELTEEQKYLLDNLLNKIYEFKKNPKKVVLSSDEKKYLKVFENLLNLLYEKQASKWRFDDSDTVYEYEPKEVTSESLLGIMSNIDSSVLKINILSNDKIYKELISIINKYHLLGWSDTFNPIFPHCDITFEEGTIAGIISYYNEILPKLGDNISLTQLIDYGNIYDTSSQVYKLLLGREDYSLIVANEGKNKASMAKYQRLSIVPSLIKKMYERKYTTIPPMDKDIELSNNKKINVVIGNSTNMMNLTYGERTNACLRIGGAFYDLFKYCIENEDGFHIRFTNPNTGKFISRVSGIRNGNTLFLNELRESVDNEYSNEDLYDAIKIVANQLVENSKHSNLPIDNIIITSDYALREHSNEEVKLHIDNRDSALRGLNFNINHHDTGIVLKTSNPDNSLVPYNFCDNVVRYECQRERVKLCTGESANDKIIQIMMINELLSGKDIDEIYIRLDKNYKICICSEDWFIGIDDNNNITKYIMPNSINKEKATSEMNISIQELDKYIDNININQGGYKR